MNLEQQVKHLDKHYRDGNALVSDKQFDKLEKQLLAINPDSDYFTNRDALPLPSLEKDTIEDFIEGLPDDTEYILEPKLDGCAVAIEYRDGKIYNAITRKGKDITNKIKHLPSVPSVITTKQTIQIRGELYCPYEPGNVSQRRAAGYLRSKNNKSDMWPFSSVVFSAFQIINSKLNQDDTLLYLSKLGFLRTTFFSSKTTSLNYLLHYKHCYFSPVYPSEYPIDGWVLKINDYKLQQTRPDYWQMAIKHY